MPALATSSSSPSSLRRAITNDANNKLKNSKVHTATVSGDTDCGGSGAFENSFAQGLDLTEFESSQTTRRNNNQQEIASGGSFSSSYNPNTARPRLSASEELLRIKDEERQRRKIHEEEEMKMQEALDKRIKYLQHNNNSSSSNKIDNRISSSCEVVDALVRMHGSDRSVATMRSPSSSNKNRGSNNRRKFTNRPRQRPTAMIDGNDRQQPTYGKPPTANDRRQPTTQRTATHATCVCTLYV